MTPDLLDDLLDGSSPATRAPGGADVAAMIAAARAEAPERRRTPRRRSVALAAGALAAVLVGGAGVAAATDGFSWAPWAQDPLGAVQFTMANGLACELRFSEFAPGSDPGLVADPAFLAEINRVLEDWYRTSDVVSAAQALVPQKRAEFEATAVVSEMTPDADVSELTPQEQEAEKKHLDYIAEWSAWKLAVEALEDDVLAEAGIPLPDDRLVGAERSGQIQCTDETGDLYAPGAGR